MSNKELIRLMIDLEKQENDFIYKLLIIKTKRNLIKKMLKNHQIEPC